MILQHYHLLIKDKEEVGPNCVKGGDSGGGGIVSLSQKSKPKTTFGLWVKLETELCCPSEIFRKCRLS